VPFVDLGPATDAVRAGFMSDLDGVLDDRAFVNGPLVERFEQEFARACSRDCCVGVASGLDALRLALLGLGLERGDEVIVPAMTFIATFEAVVQAGGKPLVVDVRPDDAGLDVEAAASAIGPRTRFAMPVHLYGQMMDVRALGGLASRHDLVVVEDACQAHGASRDGVPAGGAGAAAAFSFYPSKNLGAAGDAGALVTDDEELATRIRALREHGELRRYYSEYVGYTARLDAIQALFLAHKLPLLADWNAARGRAAAYYTEALTGVGDLRLPQVVEGATHVWHLYTIRTGRPEQLAAYLRENGVSTGRHYPQPPHLAPAFAELGLREGSFPVAEAIARETLSLPMFPGISERQLETVTSVVSSFFAGGAGSE
jgi:dTDP-3-amino-3,4,6-trideoxy-alpha-D-glucose transaminase